MNTQAFGYLGKFSMTIMQLNLHGFFDVWGLESGVLVVPGRASAVQVPCLCARLPWLGARVLRHLCRSLQSSA